MLWFLLSRDRNCFPSCYFLFVLVSVTIAIEWIVISARQSKQFLYLSTFRCNKWNWTYNNILHMKNDDFHPYFVSCFKWKKNSPNTKTNWKWDKDSQCIVDLKFAQIGFLGWWTLGIWKVKRNLSISLVSGGRRK